MDQRSDNITRTSQLDSSFAERTKYDVFVSYSRRDSDRINKVVDLLRQEWRVFFDKESIQIGNEFPQAIEKAARSSRCLVVFWSQASAKSTWVFREATIGRDQGTLVPVFL